MANVLFSKIIANIKKLWEIKLLVRDERSNCYVLQEKLHAKKLFSEISLAMEIKKTKI